MKMKKAAHHAKAHKEAKKLHMHHKKMHHHHMKEMKHHEKALEKVSAQIAPKLPKERA